MEYDWVKRKGLYDKMNQYKTEWPDLMAGAKPDKLKEILREYNKVKDRFADAYNWAGNRKGIAALARDIKADFAYDFQYDLLCQIAHNSVTLMNEYVDEHKTGKLVIRRGKNSKYRTAALATVAGHTLVLADLFGDMYELGRDEEIEELLEELKRL
jgi:hypothetical protein